MWITKLTISNYMKIQLFKVDAAGKMNLIIGGNGRGKTAALDAVRNCIQGCGTDKDLIGPWGDKAEIIIELDNKIQVRRDITANGSPAKVTDDGVRIKRDQEFLDGLLGQCGINPIEFFKANPKKQAEMFLRAVPFTLDRDNLISILGDHEAFGDINYSQHGLLVLKDIKAAVYSKRTEANRDMTQLEKVIAQAKKEIPETFDPAALAEFDLPAKSRELTAATIAINEHDSDIAGLSIKNKAINDKVAEIDKKKRELQTLEAQLEVLQLDCTSISKRIESYKAPDAASLQAEIDAYSANQELVQKMKGITRNEAELEIAKIKHGELDQFYNRLENEIPQRILSKIEAPLPGIEVREEGIYTNGVALSKLSESERMGFAVRYAKSTCGKLKLILLDGIESLDDDTKAEFFGDCKDDEYQYLMTSVGQGKLRLIRDGVEVEESHA